MCSNSILALFAVMLAEVRRLFAIDAVELQASWLATGPEASSRPAVQPVADRIAEILAR